MSHKKFILPSRKPKSQLITEEAWFTPPSREVCEEIISDEDFPPPSRKLSHKKRKRRLSDNYSTSTSSSSSKSKVKLEKKKKRKHHHHHHHHHRSTSLERPSKYLITSIYDIDYLSEEYLKSSHNNNSFAEKSTQGGDLPYSPLGLFESPPSSISALEETHSPPLTPGVECSPPIQPPAPPLLLSKFSSKFIIK